MDFLSGPHDNSKLGSLGAKGQVVPPARHAHCHIIAIKIPVQFICLALDFLPSLTMFLTTLYVYDVTVHVHVDVDVNDLIPT